MTFAIGGRSRGAMNRNEFCSRLSPKSSFLSRPAPCPRFSPSSVGRARLDRHVHVERPARGPFGLTPRPGPVIVSAPWHARYPIFSSPVVVLTGSWTPAVSLALAILGIGVLASLCLPEAAPIIMSMSIILAITSLFLKAVAGRR
ncbi:MAG: hypothetical protein LLG04_08265 [Parachlamydia sp.]|nr:hypothetical protein [Parachlamydia sp.]